MDDNETTVTINTVPHWPLQVGNDYYQVNTFREISCLADASDIVFLGTLLDNLAEHHYAVDNRRSHHPDDRKRDYAPILILLVMSDCSIAGVVQDGRNQFLHEMCIVNGHDAEGNVVYATSITPRRVRHCGRWRWARTMVDRTYESIYNFNADARNLNKIAAMVWVEPLENPKL